MTTRPRGYHHYDAQHVQYVMHNSVSGAKTYQIRIVAYIQSLYIKSILNPNVSIS